MRSVEAGMNMLRRGYFSGGDGSRLALYFKRIQELAVEKQDKRSQLLLEDLRLYGESLIPSELG